MSSSDFILIGFVDKKDEAKSGVDSRTPWKENFIGGRPHFPPTVKSEDLETVLSPDHMVCYGCKSHLGFITQISCPVDDKPHQRILYVLACVTKGCKTNKWLVIRVMAPGAPGKSPVQPVDTSSLIPEEKVSIFKPFYLSVEEEDYLTGDDGSHIDKKKLEDVMDASGSKTEVYEKFLIPGTDDVANKFLMKVSKFPRQVIRYCWMGTPLLNQETEVINRSSCNECGSPRTFEMQIMPGMISLLDKTQQKLPFKYDLDFGTVLCFTCVNNCHTRTACIEDYQVLSDPDSSILSKTFKESTAGKKQKIKDQK